MNAANLAIEGLQQHGDYTAAYYEGRSYRSTELMESVCRLTAVLQEQGVHPSDRVVVLAYTCLEVPTSFQAIWRLGAIIIPIMPQLLAREIRYMVENSGAQIVLTIPDLASKAAEATEGIDGFRKLLVFGECAVSRAIDIDPLLAATTPLETVANCQKNDLAVLVYTSGTTGHPKGVMLSHGNLISNARSTIELLPLKPMHRALMTLPMSHVYGMMLMNTGSVNGAITAYLKWFEPVKVLETIEKYRIERASLVPTMLIELIHFPERENYDTSSLKVVMAGSAPLSEEVRLEFARLYNCRMVDGYGQSEASCVVAAYRDEEPAVPVACGRAIPDVKVCIMDNSDMQLAPNMTGEICIQGDLVMQGYWGNEQATRETIVDGWLHSGDVGHLDKNGYLFITDRKKDLIIKGAENISPREIEEIIYRHPAVAECAVFGVHDAKYQEEIAAAIVLKPEQSASADEIGQHVLNFITKFKKPAYIDFYDSLPKKSNNKILKRTLRKEFGRRET
jgi:long-chain acyl-CoA synthetase